MSHRRLSSQWVPPTAPLQHHLLQFRSPPQPKEDKRRVLANHQFDCPRYELPSYCNYVGNKITTTKYNIITFLPKNLWEQLRRWANIYFICICILNFIPLFAAFSKWLGLIPVILIMTITAIKDIFEDLSRWRMDNQVNQTNCLVWDRDLQRFRRMQWQYVLVGDFVHITNNELVPADILLLRSADTQGICHIETSNLDGETSLKQKLLPKCYLPYSQDPDLEFHPDSFANPIYCMHPTKSFHEMNGFIEINPRNNNISKENMIWRGCRLRNTTFVEGIVLFAGSDTKVMLNNGRAPYKRSQVEQDTNKNILVCVLILIVMCIIGATGSAAWTAYQSAKNPPFLPKDMAWWQDGLASIGSFVICYQILIPLSLYITVEIIKLGQVFFMQQDMEMYYEETDQRLVVRSLTIPEELGQITHVMSDKTGTVTENIMMFRRCAFDENDYGTLPEKGHKRTHSIGLRPTDELKDRVSTTWKSDYRMRHFFTNMAICNTVVVNPEHKDVIEIGAFERGVYTIDNSAFYTVTEEEFYARQEEYRQTRERQIRFADEMENAENPLTDRPSSLIPSQDSALDVTDTIETTESEREIDTDKDTERDEEGALSRVSTFSKRISNSFQGLLPSLRNLLSSPAGSVRERILSKKRRHKEAEEKTKKKKESMYEAESPDELALVEGAKTYGFILEERGAAHVTLRTPSDQTERFDILRILPFDSKRKRMSVIVKGRKGPILYTKGADSAILPRLAEDERPKFFEDSDDEDSSSVCSLPFSQMSPEKARSLLHKYATRGLRTLAFTMKQMTWDEYHEFNDSYEFIEMDSSAERDSMLSQKADELEIGLELLGVTGIEDKLQDGVPNTIASLREAGLQVWLLTGDKLETAENIARSCGLFDVRVPNLNIKTLEDTTMPESFASKCNVILAPQAIQLAKEGNEKILDVIRRCTAVLCYRMTPSEKSEIVKVVQKYFNGRVLAIGDGANDVPMIQAAQVGIGLSGNEGMQAVMASDFAIARFRFLKRLLLVHGHWNYDRTANTFLYFLYKNGLLVFIIFFCQFYNGFTGESPMDPIYMMLYPIIFTSLQPIVYGVYDQCHDSHLLTNHPPLYKRSMNGECYSLRLFLLNMLDSLYQSAVIYYMAHCMYWGSEAGLWEFGFVLSTSMFLVNSVHLGLEVRCWTTPLFLVFVLLTAFHFIFFLGFHAIIGPWAGIPNPPYMVALLMMVTPAFWAVELITVVLAVLPRYVAHIIQNNRQGKNGFDINCCGFIF